MYNLFIMKLYTEKLSRKFNIRSLEGTEVEEVEVEQFAGIAATNRVDGKDFIAIMHSDEEIVNLKKINAIIIAMKDELSKEEKIKFKKLNIPIYYSKYSKRELIVTLDTYLLRLTETPERLHATMLSIYGEGVLVMGKSGIGKSEVALELISRGHLFIGDDAIDVISVAGTPLGKAPKISRDFIEVRGVGIVNIKGMFGIQSMVKEHQVDLIVELVVLDDVKESIERLGKEYSTKVIAGVEIPLIQVPVSSGRAIAPVIEAATIAYKQRRQDKYIAADDLTKRLKDN